MHEAPRVSVVISVHNDAGRIARAVRSIAEQDFRDLEVIIVDDGSTDATSSVLGRLAAEDARIRIIHQQNAGLTRALIKGCSAARGEFIARQDSDDWSHRLRISEQVTLLDRDSRVGFVSCATQYVGPCDEPLGVIERPTDPELATCGLLHDRQGPPAHGSVMFRRSAYEAVGGYRPEFYYSQDSDLWLRLAEQGLIAYLPEIRYVARKDPSSISGSRRGYQSAFARLAHECVLARRAGAGEEVLLKSAQELAAELRAAKDDRRSPSSTAHEISYLIGSQLVQNCDFRARRYLLDVLRARPLHWRAWVRLTQSLMQELRANG